MSELRLKEASGEQIRRVARLHMRTQRKRWGQTLVEGPQSVRELLRHAPQLVRDLYVTETALSTHADITTLAADTHVWTHLLSEEEFVALSTDAQGILAVINQPEQQPLEDALKNARLVVAAAHMTDPGNLGTVIRAADAAGADVVLVGAGSVELYSPKTIRSTAGSLFHLSVIPNLPFEQICEQGRAAGLHVLGADGHGEYTLPDLLDSTPASSSIKPSFSLNEPTMWVLGNEAHGFADFDTSLLDATVSIPLFGQAESLNVSMAGAILAYASALSGVHALD